MTGPRARWAIALQFVRFASFIKNPGDGIAMTSITISVGDTIFLGGADSGISQRSNAFERFLSASLGKMSVVSNGVFCLFAGDVPNQGQIWGDFL